MFTVLEKNRVRENRLISVAEKAVRGIPLMIVI